MRKYDEKFASLTAIGNGFHASVRISMTESLKGRDERSPVESNF